jgi:hypothetical protein
MLKVLSISSILLFITLSAEAQSFYAARRERSLIAVGGISSSSYFGELTNPKDYLRLKPAVSAGLQFYLNNIVSFRSELTWFELSGADSRAPAESGRQPRNLSFKSDNFELNVTAHVSLLPQGRRFYQRPPFNLYAFAGIGGLYFNPKAQLDGKNYALQPLQTELVHYSRFAFVLPFGLGAKIKLNPFMNLSIEGGYRATFTDYIDDVSTTHKDPALFTNPIAAALSDRGPEVGYKASEPGSIRGNPKTKDGYLIFGVKLEYYLPTEFVVGNNQQKLLKRKRNAFYRYNKKGGRLKRR